MNPARPTRIFNPPKLLPETDDAELKELKAQRAERLAKITVLEDVPKKPRDDPVSRDIKKKEEERLAQLKYVHAKLVKSETRTRNLFAQSLLETRRSWVRIALLKLSFSIFF